MKNSSIFDHTLLSLQISYRHYLHGSLLEDMIQENMSKFMDRMVKETGPFEPKQYISLMVFHQLYTVCFGERCVFNLYSVIIINLHFKPKWKSIFESVLQSEKLNKCHFYLHFCFYQSLTLLNHRISYWTIVVPDFQMTFLKWSNIYRFETFI